MAKEPHHAASARANARWHDWYTPALLAVVIGVAYHNSFSGPFVFDDIDSIINNPSIRQLATAWWPGQSASGLTVAGRPLVNASLAVNYAISGDAVWSYHAFNLLVHFANACLLFGLVRTTLQQSLLCERFGGVALSMATAAAMLWAVHPLQTEVVTYVIQRAESLVTLFYLLTLYAFVRSIASARGGLWRGISLGTCWAGMATKEVMVSAPVLVLLYDRTFVAGSFNAAFFSRWRYYAGLASGWLLLFGLAASTGWRGGTAGFNADVNWWHYALTQCWAIVHYLRLCAWPSPLIFDYGTAVIIHPGDVWLPMLIVITLAAAVLWCVWRQPKWGFLGMLFFAVLAPSSSFIPVATQTVAEHRIYLPLAAVVITVVAGGFVWLGRKSWILWATLVLVCSTLTIRRNEDYQSHVLLWGDTAAKRPDNAFAHFNFAQGLQLERRYAEAVPEYEEAIRLIPDYIEAHTNLGVVLQRLGRWPEAEAHYQAALRYDSRPIETLVDLGSLLLAQGRWVEAGRVYAKLLEYEPDRVDAHINVAQVLFALGHEADASDHLAEALRLDPASADTHVAVGTMLKQWGKLADAQQQFEAALHYRPNDAAARAGLEKIVLAEAAGIQRGEKKAAAFPQPP